MDTITTTVVGARHLRVARNGQDAGILHEARLFHAFVRTSQSHVEVKGGNPIAVGGPRGRRRAAGRLQQLTRHSAGVVPVQRRNAR